MAFALVHTNSPTGNTGSSVNFTITSTTAGNLIVVNFQIGDSNATVSSVADDKSNTYAKSGVYSGGAGPANNGTFYQYYGVQATGGATTITINLSASTFISAIIDEFSGGLNNQATIFDVGNKDFDNTASQTSSAVSITPAASGELISAGIFVNTGPALTAGTNYTISSQEAGDNRIAAEYRLNGTTTETAQFTWSGGSSWRGVVGSYKPITTNVLKVSSVSQGVIAKVLGVANASAKKISGVSNT